MLALKQESLYFVTHRTVETQLVACVLGSELVKLVLKRKHAATKLFHVARDAQRVISHVTMLRKSISRIMYIHQVRKKVTAHCKRDYVMWPTV